MKKTESKPNILIVDDEPYNIRILSGILKGEYTPIASTNGLEAIAYARQNKPDIILLDIMMPDMDGYEVFQNLAEDKRTKDIPVIFVTAMSSTEDEIQGFRLGCADYITKPFKPEIIKARIRTHLKLKNYCDNLEEMARQYANQLVHAERLSIIGTLSSGIGHEIANYLNVIVGFSELLEHTIDDIPANLGCSSEESEYRHKGTAILEERRRKLSSIIKAADRIITIISSMKKFSYRGDEKTSLISIRECIEETLTLCQYPLKFISVGKKINTQLPGIYGNAQQLEQVFVNLIKNAADAMETSEQKILKISAFHDDTRIIVCIADTGPGIPEDKLESIWEPFFTTKDGDKGLGLGLSITRDIISQHNGNIRAENRPGGGARFIVELPVGQAKHNKTDSSENHVIP